MCGEDVLFSTGTDEHGSKVQAAAKAAGLSPQAQVDKISAGPVQFLLMRHFIKFDIILPFVEFRELFDELSISYDRFVRSTDERHKAVAQAVWRKLKVHSKLKYLHSQ